jgi:5-deoxy-glucuronate isomerase
MKTKPLDLVRDASSGVTPESAGWTYLSFRRVLLEAGATLAAETASEETGLVWLGGRAEVDGFGAVGERADVWDGKPYALLLPPQTNYRLRAQTVCRLAVISAPAPSGSGLSPRLIRPDDVRVEIRGSGTTERRIHWLVGEKDPAARLILVEVFTPAGHWSTFPPHKHDTDDPPRERALEELYYYRIRPSQGFAFQAIYTADRSLDVSVRARHDDLVLVPRGYHVVSAAPGYDCYYLNAMAGAVREWLFTTDPDHAWLMNWKKT